MLFRLVFSIVAIAARTTLATNVTLDGVLTRTKQLDDQLFNTGLRILNATYPRVPLLNQTLPQLPATLANTTKGARTKLTVDAVSAVESAVLNYRAPLLNQTLPKLPGAVANSSLGLLAQAVVDEISAKEAAIQDVIKPVQTTHPLRIPLLQALAAIQTTVGYAGFPVDSLPSVAFSDLLYTGWVGVNLTDGLSYLAAARSASDAPLLYTISLPAGTLLTSFGLNSVVLVRDRTVLLTGIAADGRDPFVYQAEGACAVTEDCTIQGLTSQFGWGQLSAVIFSAANDSINAGAISNTNFGRRRLSQDVGANATAGSALFLRDPIYTENLNAIKPYLAPGQLVVSGLGVCKPGFYGTSCTGPTDCNNNGATNPADGSCVCFAPYMGDFCNETSATPPLDFSSSAPLATTSIPSASLVPSTTAAPTTSPTSTTPQSIASSTPGTSSNVPVTSLAPATILTPATTLPPATSAVPATTSVPTTTSPPTTLTPATTFTPTTTPVISTPPPVSTTPLVTTPPPSTPCNHDVPLFINVFDVDQAGTVLSNETAVDSNSCAALCQAVSSCTFTVYDTNSTSCLLKNNLGTDYSYGETTSSPGLITELKDYTSCANYTTIPTTEYRGSQIGAYLLDAATCANSCIDNADCNFSLFGSDGKSEANCFLFLGSPTVASGNAANVFTTFVVRPEYSLAQPSR